MGIRRTKHAVYELKYHLVWALKYRARIVSEEVGKYVREVFREIAEEYEFRIEAMEVMEDQVHVFVEAVPSYSPARIVQVLKSISVREIFKRFGEMRAKMWSGKIWSEGYLVRSEGDKVTAEVIGKYIEYQKEEEKGKQIGLFEKS